VRLVMYGETKGRKEPEVGRGPNARPILRDHTITREGKVDWKRLWEIEGKPTVPKGPLIIDILVAVDRPESHFNMKGEYNAEGRRKVLPTVKPDLSNVLKLVEDALGRLAWSDDRYFTDVHVRRRYTDDPTVGGPARVEVEVEPVMVQDPSLELLRGWAE
jgi:Holliday junction resolvase RusA-like endonuclease